MLNRLSINFILKSVIATLMAIIIAALATGAWTSWQRLGAVSRIGAVAEATSYMFTALHNLRVDRASTTRDLNADKVLTDIAQQLKDVRTADLPALKSAVITLDTIDFPTALLGAIKAGIVPIAANTMLSTSDYKFMLQDSRARALIVCGMMRSCKR